MPSLLSSWLESPCHVLLHLLPVLATVAFFTVLERSLIGTCQRRLAPHLVCTYGSGQALADALKLLFKELIVPVVANRSLFWLAPWLTLWFACAV